MRPSVSSREWTFRIQDILNAISKVERYVKGKTLPQFRENELVIDAVIRNLEIIGEASKSIPPNIKKEHSDIPWDQMNGMRNILIHEYFGVDLKIIWHAAKKDLPALQKQLERFVK